MEVMQAPLHARTGLPEPRPVMARGDQARFQPRRAIPNPTIPGDKKVPQATKDSGNPISDQAVSARFTAAARPLACCSTSNASFCPSLSVRNPAFWTALMWTKMSFPPVSGPMKP
jgi:hypothetical protein